MGTDSGHSLERKGGGRKPQGEVSKATVREPTVKKKKEPRGREWKGPTRPTTKGVNPRQRDLIDAEGRPGGKPAEREKGRGMLGSAERAASRQEWPQDDGKWKPPSGTDRP